jgi:diguanylate cyclase (GGDEF)-like protein
MEPAAPFMIAAAVVLPPGWAPLLALGVELWFNYRVPATRGRRRLDMALQMVPAYAAGAAVASVAGGPSALSAVIAAAVYLCINTGAVFAFGVFAWRRSVVALFGEGRVWLVDGSVASFGFLAAAASAQQPLALLAAVPVWWLCHHALTRPHLEQELNTDSKTGLTNARGMNECGLALVRAAGRRQDTVAMLMVDIDNFKKVNDRFGHPVGDQVIREVAARVRGSLRADAVAARIGGEEYQVLLPGCDLVAAVCIGERIRRAVADVPLRTHRGPLAVTVSVGCAALAVTGTQEAEAAQELALLTTAADIELYAAKAAGKNLVRPESGGEALDAAPTSMAVRGVIAAT